MRSPSLALLLALGLLAACNQAAAARDLHAVPLVVSPAAVVKATAAAFSFTNPTCSSCLSVQVTLAEGDQVPTKCTTLASRFSTAATKSKMAGLRFSCTVSAAKKEPSSYTAKVCATSKNSTGAAQWLASVKTESTMAATTTLVLDALGLKRTCGIKMTSRTTCVEEEEVQESATCQTGGLPSVPTSNCKACINVNVKLRWSLMDGKTGTNPPLNMTHCTTAAAVASQTSLFASKGLSKFTCSGPPKTTDWYGQDYSVAEMCATGTDAVVSDWIDSMHSDDGLRSAMATSDIAIAIRYDVCWVSLTGASTCGKSDTATLSLLTCD